MGHETITGCLLRLGQLPIKIIDSLKDLPARGEAAQKTVSDTISASYRPKMWYQIDWPRGCIY